MSTMECQITTLTIVYSTIYSGEDQRKHQSSASLAFVRRIHQWPLNFSHKEPFDDVIVQRITPLSNICRGINLQSDKFAQNSGLRISFEMVLFLEFKIN